MSGKMPAEYFREYRARRRLAGNPVRRRAGYVRDRSKERRRPRPSRALPRLVPLIETLGRTPGLETVSRGLKVAFWHEELVLDLAQERELARLEGRDPEAAVTAYRRRELDWRSRTVVLQEGAT